jgi:hypothetical protein
VKKLAIVVVLAGLAWFEPHSRAQLQKLVRPLTEGHRAGSAERKLKQIAVDVQRSEARIGALPQPGDFNRWLMQTYDSAEDPWGSAYYLEVYADSFVVASLGPDAYPRTADDVRVVHRREPTAAALGSAYQPPAPPSSGVKSSAVRNAKEAAKRNTKP